VRELQVGSGMFWSKSADAYDNDASDKPRFTNRENS
jgi:hypothetical protein